MLGAPKGPVNQRGAVQLIATRKLKRVRSLRPRHRGPVGLGRQIRVGLTPLENYPDPMVRSAASTITKKNRKFWCNNEKPVFQAQFPMRERFVRVDFSISSVFSIALNIPTPPASTVPRSL